MVDRRFASCPTSPNGFHEARRNRQHDGIDGDIKYSAYTCRYCGETNFMAGPNIAIDSRYEAILEQMAKGKE